MSERSASLAMVESILDTVALWLAESGCPLTAEQRVAFDDAKAKARQDVFMGVPQ